jgi:hypothetical protein
VLTSSAKAAKDAAAASKNKEDTIPYIMETNRLLLSLIRKYDEAAQ